MFSFSKVFLHLFKMILWFLFFPLLTRSITFFIPWIFNHPCISGVNLSWSWCTILLTCCWICFTSILLRIFALFSLVQLICHFLFCGVLVWLNNEVIKFLETNELKMICKPEFSLRRSKTTYTWLVQVHSLATQKRVHRLRPVSSTSPRRFFWFSE